MPPSAVIVRSLARLILWIYAYYAFEWLFFVTTPSVVSAAGWGGRLLMLAVPALRPIAFAILPHLLLSSLELLRPRAERRWFAALLPSLVQGALLFIAVENFVKTIWQVGIVDIHRTERWLWIAAVVTPWLVLYLREARLLGQPKPLRPLVAQTAAALAVSLIALPFVFAGKAPASAPDVRLGKLARTPNILLIGIDGVSASHVGAYGYKRPTTPNLDRLATRATLFENAFSNCAVTYGSLVSLHTGKASTETHVMVPPTILEGDAAVQHLPGILRRAGYRTAQIGTRYYSDAGDWNMRGGWDMINGRRASDAAAARDLSTDRERLRRFADDVQTRIVDRLLHLFGIRQLEDAYRFVAGKTNSPFFADKLRVRMAEDWIVARQEPWMLNIHLLDTHCCNYGFAPHRFTTPGVTQNAAWRANRLDDSLVQDDAYLEHMLDLLRTTGQLDRTIVVVYSDHGLDWSPTTRVPFVIAWPGQRTPSRVKANVQLIDLAPTLLHHLGIPKPEWMSGQSLLEPAKLDPRRPLFALRDSGGLIAVVPQPLKPPFYGARSATVVICDQWVELLLTGQPARSGRVADHTAPCNDPDFAPRARAILAAHLRENRYPVPETR